MGAKSTFGLGHPCMTTQCWWVSPLKRSSVPTGVGWCVMTARDTPGWVAVFRSRLEGETAVLLAASEVGQGDLAGGSRWCVQPGQLPAGRLALQRAPLLPSRPGRCAPLLRGRDVLCLALSVRQRSVHYVSHSYLCAWRAASVRLVVRLLLARSAMGTVSEALSQGGGGFSHALGKLVSALLSRRLLR